MYLKDLLECNFKLFKIALLDIKWYMIQNSEHGLETTIIEYDNGFTMVNRRNIEAR